MTRMHVPRAALVLALALASRASGSRRTRHCACAWATNLNNARTNTVDT